MLFRILLTALIVVGGGCTRDWDGRVDASKSGAGAHGQPSASMGAAGLPGYGGSGFASYPDRGDLVAYQNRRDVRRDGAYTWHRAELSEEHALKAIVDGRLTVTLPSGETSQFQYERRVEHPSGDWTWVGRLEGGGEGDQAILTFGEKAAFGSIAQRGKESLRLTMRDGVSWLVETDPNLVGQTNNAATRPARPDFIIPPKTSGRVAAASGRSAEASAPIAESAVSSATGTVDVVLGYTPGFADALGGQSQALTRLNFLVDVANQAYVNSQVDARMRLVHAIQVSYPDNTNNGTALEELTGFRAPSTRTAPAPAFATLRAVRDQYGADLVSLVRKFNDPENDGCGIAWLIGGGQSGIDASDEFFGYSVVSDGSDVGSDGKTYFCRDETLAHELGHNMGSQHDRSSATDNGMLKYGVFPYSFGYKTAADAGNFYTIMAYGDTGQTRYRAFSNPRITFCGGYPCGVVDQSDNARSLGQTMPIVATFRATVIGERGAVKNDIDGDGKSDLLWHYASGGTGIFGYWIMQGTQVVRAGSMGMDPRYRVAATGDFNGDKMLDIIWTSDARDTGIWFGNGSTFGPAGLPSYAAGWSLVGAGDIDGDGKSDLLWHYVSGGTGIFGYWIMDGTQVVRTGSMGMDPRYRVAATGDFNGDKKLDIVWTSDARDLGIWFGNGSTFGPAGLPSYAAGWSLVGAGDIDGDGKSDLLWHYASGDTGIFGYWIMDGIQIVRTGSMSMDPRYRVAATGDFNGDRKLDIIWTSDARDTGIWFGNGSTFGPAGLPSYAAGWSIVP